MFSRCLRITAVVPFAIFIMSTSFTYTYINKGIMIPTVVKVISFTWLTFQKIYNRQNTTIWVYPVRIA
jgi:hypothetical protein